MEKAKKIAFVIISLVCVFGLFTGPFSWWDSATFHGKYNDLQATGTKSKALIDSKKEAPGYRSTHVTVNVHFTDKASNKVITVEKININHGYYDDLRTGQIVDIYYKGKNVVLIDNYKDEYVPIIRWKYWGMIYTLVSYSFIIGMVINTRRKKLANK